MVRTYRRGRIDERALRRMASLLTGDVSTALEDRICYSFDATDFRALPDAVAWPRTTADVVSLLRVARELGVPVVPRGAGTGYTGGSLPVQGGLVISFERMNSIVALDARARVAVVEPGVVNQELTKAAEAVGLFYPPDPASLKVSTLGGNVAEDAGGPRTVLHGTTRDYVLGLEAVLADGTIIVTGVLAGDTAIGWDAGVLLVGSEGTLAVVTKIAVRLADLPLGLATYWAEFPSLEAAARAVAAITASGLAVSVLEILDRETTACALEYVRGTSGSELPEGALLVELEGDPATFSRSRKRLSAMLEAAGALSFREAADESEREEIWEIRRAISPAIARLSSGKINEDIVVPRSAIPRFVHEMHEISRAVDLPILAFGHAGDGNLHVNVIVDLADPDERNRARRAVRQLFRAALSMGGTLSGEHGIGITKAEHLADALDQATLAATRAVKRALDPHGLVNPGKILTARPSPWWDTAPADDGGPRC